MATAADRLVFVMGKELHGNRQVLVVNSGEEYNDYLVNQATAYTAQTARYPYDIAS